MTYGMTFVEERGREVEADLVDFMPTLYLELLMRICYYDDDDVDDVTIKVDDPMLLM